MKRILCQGILLFVGAASLAAVSYQQASSPPATLGAIEKVKENLYFIPGGEPAPLQQKTWAGGNVAVFVTENGVVVVDTMLAGMGPQILERIRSVTSKPITTIINTHTHFDHSGSNTEFPATVEVVAHENTKAYMSKTTCPPVTNCDSFKGENARFLPRQTFKDKLSLFSGKDRIDLYHFGAGHTGGDAFVVFPALRSMHSGDIFGMARIPFIDLDNGGSFVEYPRTLAKAVAGIENVDTIITGHMTRPVKWDLLEEFTAFANDFVDTVRAGVNAGKSVEAIAASYRPAAGHEQFASTGQRLNDQIRNISDELKRPR